ncbi:M24 family metallopeptidase [Natronincola ferrireducens]|uniref:Xaa-Pro dipeptidase n=1 Tax=Natronincola ferrireducens TaxID=393762 RepID=A0A1G8YFF3_9FIRM|nr:Xaa-Pro peptidase family protein [Natronincola ferrireducens]SDK01441.1 Xaa-Pro dipeptidase [Natronincola ferrireducens]
MKNIALEKLCKEMSNQGINGFMLGVSTDLEYFTGFHPKSCSRFQALFVMDNGKKFYIVPEILQEEAIEVLPESTTIVSWADDEYFLKKLSTAVDEFGLNNKVIAVNEGIKAIDLLDIQNIMKAKFHNGKDILEKIRVRKTAEEIHNLREAAKLADAVMEDLTKYIRPGIQEKDIKKKIEELFSQKGADELAFDPIIASGPNSSKPHYNDAQRYIQEEDIIILDFGCRYKGYCSDISRTLFVGGATPKQKDIYNIIYRANAEAKEMVKPGITAETVDKAARTIIKDAGYGQYFLCRTGHGIGMAVHESPYIKTGNQEILQEGMAFSIEPGIYLSGQFGMRIEDIVVVTDNGVEVLNQFPRELIVL